VDARFNRIHDAAREEETYRDWLESSVSLVCGTFGLIKRVGLPEAWVECEKFIPHLRSLDKTWDDAHGVNLESSRTNVRVARYMKLRGGYDEAEALLMRTLSDCERHLEADHPDTLNSMDGLAVVYESQGRYDEAVTLLQHASAGSEKRLGPDHTLNSMRGLASLYEAQGRHDEAEVLCARDISEGSERTECYS